MSYVAPFNDPRWVDWFRRTFERGQGHGFTGAAIEHPPECDRGRSCLTDAPRLDGADPRPPREQLVALVALRSVTFPGYVPRMAPR